MHYASRPLLPPGLCNRHPYQRPLHLGHWWKQQARPFQVSLQMRAHGTVFLVVGFEGRGKSPGGDVDGCFGACCEDCCFLCC
jgi:hypothetical protein